MQFIENKTFDEIMIGDTAELKHTLQKQDIELFAIMSGDINPAHLDDEFAKTDPFHKVIAHGMWGGALISALLGTELPGPGTIYLNQSLSFRRPVGLGDTITAKVRVREKIAGKQRVILDCECLNQAGEAVILGEAVVIAPAEKIRRPRALLPELHLHERGARFEQIMDAARRGGVIRTAVICPCDEASLISALDAGTAGFILPVLVGPRAEIEQVAQRVERRIDGIEIVDAPHSRAAAERAVALARERRVEALVQGALHTDELMAAVIDAKSGLRTERRISHVSVLDASHYPKPLLITDAAVIVSPDLYDKRDIIQNAIDLAHALGVAEPKVAILSAVGTVNPKIRSTIEAAALCKMAERGQITGGILDGPLALDKAVSRAAAATRHTDSPVAGDADILVVPDLEAGNMLAKLLIYLAGADAAGVVLGARVPIVLASPADGTLVRMASCALAQLFVHRRARPSSPAPS
jgi:phosphotransacetylase/acyl dehydratase